MYVLTALGVEVEYVLACATNVGAWVALTSDLSEFIKTDKDLAQEKSPDSATWLSENVWSPMVNGSGVIQQANNFREKDIPLLKQGEATLGSPEWAVQTLSGVAGAIVPYVIAGKLTGKVFSSVGEKAGLTGMSARIARSGAVANVVGAGIYDFAKVPLEGETRLGTGLGTMAGFSIFEGGNHLIKKSSPLFNSRTERIFGQNLARAGVGAVGGLTTYETSHVVSAVLGEKDKRNWDHRIESMVSGGFMNVALPAVHNSATRAIDFGYNSRSFGPGVPIERYLGYNQITDPAVLQSAHMNPLARVKIAPDGVTKADVKSNVVHLAENATAAKLGHELRHLRIAVELEPHYKAIAELAKIDPSRAENQFYNMRAYAEFQARMMEGLIDAKTTAEGLTKLIASAGEIGDQKASNGKTYNENWQQEWQQMQRDPKSRPRFEYVGEAKVTDADPNRQIRVTEKAAIGSPTPLGATVTDQGINFAVRSTGATKVELLLFGENVHATEPVQTLPMNRTGDVWHTYVDAMQSGTTYLYRAFGSYNPAVDGTRFNGKMALVDPYSKAVTGDSNRPLAYDNSDPNDPQRHLRPGDVDAVKDMQKSVAVKSDFDWQGDKPPATAMTDSFIYELNVKGFTNGIEALGNLRGTYRGLVEKIPHLKRIGVTAVELLPVTQFEKIDSFNGQMGEKPVNPETGEPLRNQWGYQTIAYQAPEASYAADGVRGQQVNEFKFMVRELHKANIEVILDVVFNHTAEDGHLGPTISFRGLDNNVYYMLAPNAPEKYVDHTGCRNTLNVNEPAVQALILDTLRYWTKEMHVDGFRFDLATVFNYDVDGIDKHRTPILEAIEKDPDLGRVKLIAEPWSIDQYKVGSFAPTRWAEWNGVFRDTVRRFLKSDGGMLADLSERIAGSPRWFDAAKGRHSINFVTAHDGFTLKDWASYNEKHNLGNGEGNRDGANDNYSWNHGVEGPVENANIPAAQKIAIEQLRNRQAKNALAMLLLSQGTPMMLAGDEFGRTTKGNNNYWSQEKLNTLDWALVEKNADTVRFLEVVSQLRKEFEIGRRLAQDISWHGTKPLEQSFQGDARFIAWDLPATATQPKRLYSAFNAYWEPLEVTLPEGSWRRRVDTSLPGGQDALPSDQAVPIKGNKYIVQPRTGIILESEPTR